MCDASSGELYAPHVSCHIRVHISYAAVSPVPAPPFNDDSANSQLKTPDIIARCDRPLESHTDGDSTRPSRLQSQDMRRGRWDCGSSTYFPQLR